MNEDPNSDIMPLKVTFNGEEWFCNGVEYNPENKSLMLALDECGMELLIEEATNFKIEPK
jgi:hypothetical protein